MFVYVLDPFFCLIVAFDPILGVSCANKECIYLIYIAISLGLFQMNNFKRSIVALIVVCLLHHNHAWLLGDFNMDFSRKINTSTTTNNTCNCFTVCYGGFRCGYSCNYSCGNVGGRRRVSLFITYWLFVKND